MHRIRKAWEIQGNYIPENQLPTGTNNPTVTREQFLKMTYQERLNLKDSNEELYSKLTKGR